MKVFWNFKSERPSQPPKHTEVNIYSKPWTKFLLNNRESAGINCQPMKLPSHRYPLKKLEEKLPQQQGNSYPWRLKSNHRLKVHKAIALGLPFLTFCEWNIVFSMVVITATFLAKMSLVKWFLYLSQWWTLCQSQHKGPFACTAEETGLGKLCLRGDEK